MAYRVELPVFSGPLDLLLHLIKQQEVDVHEVSIARILDQYLAHLDVLQVLDLADLGDFLVMASTLMEIKSRELLPHEAVSVAEELDPRDDLIRRLLQYKRYRDLARRFDRLARRRARMAGIGVTMPEGLIDEAEAEPMLDLAELDVWSLTAAFARLLEETGANATLHVGIARRDVRYYTERLLRILLARPEVPFVELFDRSEGRYGLIGAFAAMLELMKQGYLRAHQDQCYGPILVAYVGPSGLTVDEVLAGQRPEAAAVEADQHGGGSVLGNGNGHGNGGSGNGGDA